MKNKYIQFFIFLLIVSPAVLVGAFSYRKMYEDLTDITLSRRQTVAYLAATVLKEKFDRLSDIAVSLGTRVRFRRLVEEGRWQEAAEILKDVSSDFPFVERIFLTDTRATIMSDIPALLGTRGRNFAERDWYRGVSSGWKVYVSGIYQRAAEPRYNVVAIAAPIKSESKKVLGVLVLQIRGDQLFQWSRDIDIGSSGFVYFVDKRGQIAAHPRYPAQGAIADYSGVPVVQKVLRGERGVENAFNSIENAEQLAAYAPVAQHGWGVIVQQPTAAAFSARAENLRSILIIYGVIFILSCVFAHLVLRALKKFEHMEQETRKLNVKLEYANKELEAFNYTVSHDLRTPLRGIDGFSQILLEDHADKLDVPGKELLQRIRAATKRMAQLINDMLNFARITRIEISRETVDLSAMAQAIASELHATQPGRQVEFIIAKGIGASGDAGLLRVVLENLFGNAWKFTEKHASAKIEFGTTPRDAQSVYFVRDDGAGFDMAYVHKLFGVFQRLHGIADFKGTGIGLATVQRIIHRHGGKVWAEGQIEKGAAFYFTLNQAKDGDQAPTRAGEFAGLTAEL